MSGPGRIWQQLTALLSAASEQVVLIAPFIKRDIFESAIAEIPSEVKKIQCITRWSPSEIAAGASDPEIVQVAETDGRIQIHLCHALHAKLFIADEACLIGSANLTAKAVGIASPANIEILVETTTAHPEVQALLASLRLRVTPATAELAALMREQSRLLSKASDQSADQEKIPLIPWYPNTRNPNRLYRAYRGEGILPTSIREGILIDLAHLDLPAGLTESEFNDAVRAKLRSIPGLQRLLDQQCLGPEDLRQVIQEDADEEELRIMTETLATWVEHFEQFYRSYGGWELRRGRELS